MDKTQQLRDRGYFVTLLNNVTKSIKDAFSELLTGLEKKVFRVRIENEKYFTNALEKTASAMEKTGASIKDFRLAGSLDKINVDLINSIHNGEVQNVTIDKSGDINIKEFHQNQEEVVNSLSKLGQQLTQLEDIAAGIKTVAGKKDIVVPQPLKSVEIDGNVSVDYLPEKLYAQLNELKGEVRTLEAAIKGIKIEAPAQKDVVIPESFTIKNMSEFTKALKELQTAVKDLPKMMPSVDFPDMINIGNFPPQKTPQPVTNININPLRGVATTTAVTVTNSPTLLPPTTQQNRRSMIIYNNDASATLYLGGSDVTANTGIPVAPKSFSPAIDAGPKMLLYGITATGSVNVRVLEASNESIGG